MVGGILLVNQTSSPAAAKLPTEERAIVKPVPEKTRTGAMPPIATLPRTLVYPVGMGGKNDTAYTYIVKDGKLWYCEDTIGRRICFLQ
jgi:hypothetical protein